MFKDDNKELICDDSGRANEIIINFSKNKKFKNLTYIPNIEAIEKLKFLTFNAKKVFNYLQLAFIKGLIL